MSLLFPRIARFSQPLPGILKRTLFGFGSKSHNNKIDAEAKELLNVFVDPLSKAELKYIQERHVYLAEEIGVEYPVRDGIFVMSPNEATLVVNDKHYNPIDSHGKDTSPTPGNWGEQNIEISELV